VKLFKVKFSDVLAGGQEVHAVADGYDEAVGMTEEAMGGNWLAESVEMVEDDVLVKEPPATEAIDIFAADWPRPGDSLAGADGSLYRVISVHAKKYQRWAIVKREGLCYRATREGGAWTFDLRPFIRTKDELSPPPDTWVFPGAAVRIYHNVPNVGVNFIVKSATISQDGARYVVVGTDEREFDADYVRTEDSGRNWVLRDEDESVEVKVASKWDVEPGQTVMLTSEYVANITRIVWDRTSEKTVYGVVPGVDSGEYELEPAAESDRWLLGKKVSR
jgi:hypothetical protein